MKGLPTKALSKIKKAIEGQFDALSLKFLGLVPNVTKEKRIVFSTQKKQSLISLYLSAIGNKNLNRNEEQLLKAILSIASGYIEGLKHRTVARVINDVDGYIRTKSIGGEKPSAKEVKRIIDDNMSKAKNQFKMIANCESNRAVNMGTAMQISEMATKKGEKDPVVFFVVTIDDVTGSEEFVLHLLPDKKTPRVWRLSEIKNNYHKKGDPQPSTLGLHPNCRCKITYLADNFGFDKDGKVTYKNPDWDEFKYQREKYGLPR